MKFGTTFAAARHPTWRCIDYDMLKAMIKRGCSTADFSAALSNEVILVDMHFMQLRETMRVADSVIDPAALRSHAVINYVALLKIIKKATRRLGGGHTALTKQQEKGWSHLLQSSFCQCLLLSSVFIEMSPRTATMVDDDGVDSPSSGRDNGEQPANCPVCLQDVSLLRLECGHGACEACLAHCASAGLKSCPLCRAPSTLDPACRSIEALLGTSAPKYQPAACLAASDGASGAGAAAASTDSRGWPCESATAPAQGSGRETPRKTLVIAIDGCRPDALLWSDTPHIDAILEDGAAYSFHARCGEVSLSGPSWATVFTGLLPSSHGVENNLVEMSEAGKRSNLFAQAKRANQGARTSLFSAASWTGVEAMLAADSDEATLLNGADEATSLLTATEQLCDQLLRFDRCDRPAAADGAATAGAACPDLTVLYSHHVDGVGHRLGFAPHLRGYRAAIELVDACVGQVHAAIKRRMSSLSEDWLLVLTTDHGGTSRAHMSGGEQELFDGSAALHRGVSQAECVGVHGMDLDQHRNVFVIAACATHLVPGEMLPAPSHEDIVPTILHHLCGASSGVVRAKPTGPAAPDGQSERMSSAPFAAACLCGDGKACFVQARSLTDAPAVGCRPCK